MKGIDTMKKMTKKEMFNQILTHLTDVEEINFIKHEIELLENKKTGSRKPTANQVANENFKEIIVEILTNSENAMTVGEIQANDETLALLTNQRVSALLTQLKKEELVVRLDGRKALFTVVRD